MGMIKTMTNVMQKQGLKILLNVLVTFEPLIITLIEWELEVTIKELK